MRQIEGVLDFAIYVGSVVGLALSTILALYGISIFPTPVTGIFAILSKWDLLALFPVGFVFVFRYNSLTRDLTPREVERNRYLGCPSWMSQVAYWSMGIGAVLFFIPIVFETLGYIPKGNYSAFGTESPSTLVGGFGLIAYSSIFAQLYSLKALTTHPIQPPVKNSG